MKRRNNIGSLFLRTTLKDLLWLILLLILSGCGTSKYLKEGESFYSGSKIEFNTEERRIGRKKTLAKELTEFITPKPSTKILGMRPAVWFYFKAGPTKKEKGFRYFMRTKLGKPPVLLSDVAPERTAKLLGAYLTNEGYFKSKVTTSVKTKKKESTVIYSVLLRPPFRLREIHFPVPKDSVYVPIIASLKQKTLLKPQQRFELDRLEAEQKRIEKELKDQGFYYFDDRYLIFSADSTAGKRQIDLDLELEKNTPQRAKRIYHINRVTIFADYELSADSVATRGDTIVVDGYNYVQRLNNFRPQVITRVINFWEGEKYSREAHDLTISHLMGLGTFKFVDIKFRPKKGDSALLNADIYLTPLKKKSIRMEFQGVSKSNNFVGPGISATFTNRNFLGGAELFQVKISSAYEVQLTRQNANSLNAFEFGLESSLTVPRFILPFRHDFSMSRYLPKTRFKAGVNIQNRVGYFRLNSFNVGYGYNWRETVAKTHELFPLDLTYVRTDKTSPEFLELLEKNKTLANSFENQFILGTRYTYTINTQLREEQTDRYEKPSVLRNSIYFSGGVDLAGNLLHAVQLRVTEQEGPLQLFGYPYSQFIRADADFRYYWQPTRRDKIATRLAVGAGYAYGNSTTLPYIKQFAVGGSNSLRAFPARSVGPGTYNVRTDPNFVSSGTLFVDQRADTRFEANIEYRFDIYKKFKGALFVDAGNIWTWNVDPSRPGSQFHSENFLKELAAGTGLGFRYDFSFFVLRLDVAFPIRKPFLPENERWVFNKIDFSDAEWRASNLIFNIAIGYPF